MSLSSVFPALPGVYTQKHKQKVLETTSNAASSVHSKKSKNKHLAEAEKQKVEAEVKAAKEREQQSVRLYEVWSKIKQEEKDEHYQYLKERVAIQHELIKRQDSLFKKRQAHLEQKRWQLKEAKRLSKMAKSKEYTDFVRNVLAQDKKKALRLKSHVRVISSHEPVRAPQSARDTKSSYESAKTQSPGQSSLDSHGTAVVESSLLTDNFKELLHDPVEVQLQKLLGADAEDFLHPTFREGAKKTLNPMATQRKLSGIGARELWGILRSNSQSKLETQDDMIPVDVKNAYRAFLRECLHNNVPTVRRSFCKGEENETRLARLPTLALTDADGERHSIQEPPSPRAESTHEPEKKDVIVGGEKIVFLTEEMATCEGEFAKRHKALGCSKEMAPLSKGPHRGINIRETLSAPPSSMGSREAKKSQGRLWEPLSLSALLEYNAPVPAPGSGEFLLGQTKRWKIQ
nr:uncharacterized protein LOC131770182 isoform X2 [Pocillopora verrucosa]